MTGSDRLRNTGPIPVLSTGFPVPVPGDTPLVRVDALPGTLPPLPRFNAPQGILFLEAVVSIQIFEKTDILERLAKKTRYRYPFLYYFEVN